ncbi:MAG: BCCT family transporter [Eubacteriaceae bacterium]
MEKKKQVRWEVFIPTFIIIGGAALLGILNNEMLTAVTSSVFVWSLQTFGWLYQWLSLGCLFIVILITFSKVGNVRFGGKDAKAKFSFGAWFAMTLTGGIATGLITYGVNEIMIYLGDIYGELGGFGIEPGSTEAAIFGMGRLFYNWTFIPYAMYAIAGVAIAYMYFNRKEELSVTSALVPILGEKAKNKTVRGIVDTLAVLAIALGLASSLGAGLALIGAGLETAYGIKQGPVVWFILFAIITATFTIASVAGIDKGIKFLASGTTKIFYVLLFFLFFTGPILYILNMTNVGLGYWLDHFWTWGLDPHIVGGEALVTWWTMYDWAIWIAYAPLMGIFFAMIAYGRTIRQFMIINWILPSAFSFVWMAIWSNTALHWQLNGKVDLIGVIKESGAVAGLWAFLQELPLSFIIIPLIMITLIAAFSTTADTMSTTIATVCTKNAKYDEEAPNWQKIVWGVSIGLIAFVMVAFGGGAQGVDGVKYLAACGGFVVLTVFVLIVASACKMFFIDKLVYEPSQYEKGSSLKKDSEEIFIETEDLKGV